MTRLIRTSIAAAALLCFASNAAADLILSAPPRESADEARKTYDPMAEYLSTVIGERVVYEQPRTWNQYSKLMQEGHYDIVFDGPHFAAWRIKNLRHAPVVKLPGTLGFVVIARADDKLVNKTRDLVAAGVCALPKPNLGTIALTSEFTTGLAAPEIVPVKGGFDDVIVALKAGKCRAGVVREQVFLKLSDDDKKQFKVVHTTIAFPNQTITVSDRVPQPARHKLVAALAEKPDLPAAKRIFDENSKQNRSFVAASPEDFRDAEKLLEGAAWGW